VLASALHPTPVVHGFIARDLAQSMLAQCVVGTFILRFSDSNSGCLAIAYVMPVAAAGGARKIDHFLIKLTPRGYALTLANKTELVYPTLSELLLKCQLLQFVYPGFDKRDIFQGGSDPAMPD
jgi:hypothetical protein